MITAGLRTLPPGGFDGIVPAALATCSEDGTPNTTWLSRVFLVDEHTLAITCQFFRKTRANLDSNPAAQLLLSDPATARQWEVDVRFSRSETEGETYEAMRRHLEASAAMTRFQEVFALRSADVFEVLAIRELEIARHPVDAVGGDGVDPLPVMARLTERIAACRDLGALVDAGLGFLSSELGFDSVSLYVHEEGEGALYALASRGFSSSGVGARIALGVGVVGMCAQHRLPIRIADTTRELRYRRAVAEQVERTAARPDREIPLPGLEGPRSILAVPLVLQRRLFGVLATESHRSRAFTERDAQLLSIAGQLVAQAVALHRDDEGDKSSGAVDTVAPGTGTTLRVRYYEADDSVFVDGEYLIKGLPGKVLWLVLTLRQSEGRSTFLNRELRLHPFLKLPSYKDNLETRRLMLQRRLDEKGLAIRLNRELRGRLQLECDVSVELEHVPS